MKSLIEGETEKRLNRAQMELAQRDVPVLIVFEGGSGRVISRVVNEIARSLEPRCVTYHHFDVMKSGPRALANMVEATPGKGEIALFDRSWYSMFLEKFNGVKGGLAEGLKVIRAFEEYLQDNGTYLIKIDLSVTPEAMKDYAEQYRPFTPLSGTFLSVDRIDRVKYWAMADEMISGTDTDRAPWDRIQVGEIAETLNKVAEAIAGRFERCLKNAKWKAPSKHAVS
ncbi:hypothetical protein TALC_00591 [Thermoplasmatales archaeon BRNA1]|nr:hypothetical protein TALC_00591 [Thermoplasmatales archaeon BRNA1]